MFLVTAHAQDEGVLLLLRLANQERAVVRPVVAQHVNRLNVGVVKKLKNHNVPKMFKEVGGILKAH